MSKLNLSLSVGNYDRTQALFDGRVSIEGCNVRAVPLEPEEAFHRAFRYEEFDVTEISMSSHMMTTARGDNKYIGIPAFLSRVGGFALVCWDHLEHDPALAAGFEHVVALDPPPHAHLHAGLTALPGSGYTHLAWGAQELDLARRILQWEHTLRPPLIALYRALLTQCKNAPLPAQARVTSGSPFWSTLDRDGVLSAGWVQVLPVLASACKLTLDNRELNAKLVDLSQNLPPRQVLPTSSAIEPAKPIRFLQRCRHSLHPENNTSVW